MPELPDIELYVDALNRRLHGRTLETVKLNTPFILRSVDPPVSAAENQVVTGVQRLGKRIVIALDNRLRLVIHLMIAGRLHWYETGRKYPPRKPLALFHFDAGVLTLTEAGSKRRASLYVVDNDGLAAMDRGGVEVLDCDLSAFTEALTRRNHTLKRALADPSLFSGIGNAYSDEILLRARLSPVALTQKLDGEAIERLFASTRRVLSEWTARLRAECGDGFPEKVTAFRPEMGAHGRYGRPCPQCGTTIQRIRYAHNETNYCPRCQTGGKLLADRALSRLLKQDWPASIDELERKDLHGPAERK